MTVVFSKPNLTLFALLFLCKSVGEGEAPATVWPRGGGNVCPGDVASESEKRFDLAYAFFTFHLIPIADYSCKTKEHCRTMVTANRGPAPRDMAGRRRKSAPSLRRQ